MNWWEGLGLTELLYGSLAAEGEEVKEGDRRAYHQPPQRAIPGRAIARRQGTEQKQVRHGML